MSAVSRLCKYLKIPTKVLGYAGTKDKRAITAQWCTAKRKTQEEVMAFNRPLGSFNVSYFIEENF